MREGGKTKDRVLADIENRGRTADARFILREYVEHLSAVHEEIRTKIQAAVEAREDRIAGAIQRYRSGFQDVVGLAAAERDSEGRYLAADQLFDGLIKRRRRFLLRNPTLVNLTRRHVSSEPWDPTLVLAQRRQLGLTTSQADQGDDGAFFAQATAQTTRYDALGSRK